MIIIGKWNLWLEKSKKQIIEYLNIFSDNDLLNIKR